MARAPVANVAPAWAGAATPLTISWTDPWQLAQVGPATLASPFIHFPWTEAATCSTTSPWQFAQAR